MIFYHQQTDCFSLTNVNIVHCFFSPSLFSFQRHLSDAEFEAVLQCTRAEFYRLPQWRRNEIKRRARLF